MPELLNGAGNEEIHTSYKQTSRRLKMTTQDEDYFYGMAAEHVSVSVANAAATGSPLQKYATAVNEYVVAAHFLNTLRDVWDNPNYTGEVKTALTVIVVANNFTVLGS